MSGNLYPGYNPRASRSSGGQFGRSGPRPGAMRRPTAPSADQWVLGVPGGGLENADWAANAGVAEWGRAGELRTAELLNKLSRPNEVCVLHDLRMPIPGFKVNIDHGVVTGNKVLIVDTKVWAPGFFWTMAGHTRRGFKRFDPADKQTMRMAAESLGGYLGGGAYRLPAKVVSPALLAVWPSNQSKSPRFWALSVPNAKVMPAPRIDKAVEKLLDKRPANAMIVAALSELLVTQPRQHGQPPRFEEF